jgi:hypothetical protein
MAINGHSQTITSPFQDYYRSFDNPTQVSAQLKIYVFEADFTGDGRKSIFITDDRCRLGPHEDYSWTVYYPTRSGKYLEAGSFVDAGLTGPDYIGYINQVKRFGAIRGSKDAVIAQYLDNGAIKWQKISELSGGQEAAYFPKYFPALPTNYHINTYTLGDLSRKYGRVIHSPSATSASK